MEAELLELLSARHGHFRLESGHHGSLWLDLDSLFLEPERLRPFARDLARRLSAHRVEAVVGPQLGGALVAEMVAGELDIPSCFSQRVEGADSSRLYAVRYRIPDTFHDHLRGRTVAIVDDAINAGSATRATFAALTALGARPVAVGALLLLGNAASAFLRENNLPAERIAFLANELWEPAACPLCAAGIPLSIPPAAG
jgi:orotate phosphoribosyltransferase